MTAHRISLSQIAEQQGGTMEEVKKRKNPADQQARFWRAVLAMWNHTMVNCKADYWDDMAKGRSVQGSLWEAINIVGNYLDHVIEDGWMDDKE